ncbi:MAG: phosphoribosyl-AMP cyclohydrolase [Deltaproteobacteria bacterium]|jgi:phosphoribosyl-AMP cyclohydrolase|nr:phosphoribosyl-AMP cyclohydrolase [Deltaproteobacteria bacterium]MBT4268875.1 phosphoribosyl-AMP cyclohydrolase [Deltaproteobacteria bacterium]MBT4641849.1 phosphoribosyl-AMP cyclohydrolase [Deltaproteobacteria bacterium]MBT6504590.1 phosphoribosyl-AMP cyclohydrolase [Deltaproteobacteria bacterium]MBT6611259.1 phosphoribosyl-AMP cyclohydrolase [Deltaproteobacteria bacterium]
MSDAHFDLEEGSSLKLDFTKISAVAECGEAVLPAVVQDAKTLEVLITGYVNQQALDYALKEKVATLWSTSRNELWIKGKTSGEYLDLVETRVNCEQNSILYLVEIRGKGACHTRKKDGSPRYGCYYRRIDGQGGLKKISD